MWGTPRGCSRVGVGTVVQAPCARQRWSEAWGPWDCVVGIQERVLGGGAQTPPDIGS